MFGELKSHLGSSLSHLGSLLGSRSKIPPGIPTNILHGLSRFPSRNEILARACFWDPTKDPSCNSNPTWDPYVNQTYIENVWRVKIPPGILPIPPGIPLPILFQNPTWDPIWDPTRDPTWNPWWDPNKYFTRVAQISQP